MAFGVLTPLTSHPPDSLVVVPAQVAPSKFPLMHNRVCDKFLFVWRGKAPVRGVNILIGPRLSSSPCLLTHQLPYLEAMGP